MKKKEPTPELVADPALEVLKKNELARVIAVHELTDKRVIETIDELVELLGKPNKYGTEYHTRSMLVERLEMRINKRNSLALDIKTLKGEHHA